MNRRSAQLSGNSQPDAPFSGEIFSRFRDERVRIEPHQGRFAEKMGIGRRKLSNLETGESELRVADLAIAAQLGVDVLYVVTGIRSEASALDAGAAILIDDYLALPEQEQLLAQRMLQAMRHPAGTSFAPPSAATVHGRQQRFNAGDGKGGQQCDD